MTNGIRKNAAKISQDERDRLRDAFIELGRRKYPDGVSYWHKQDAIHQATHVHMGASFLPWHRELCNRLEALLREVDPGVSLHYWDWTTDPRASDNGTGGTINLFTDIFMGSASGTVGTPFESLRPPTIIREVAFGAPPPSPPSVQSDEDIIGTGNTAPIEDQFRLFHDKLEKSPNHNRIHPYIGGNIAGPRSAFEDPFVFLLHSNVDRLWASWQLIAGEEWRLNPNQVYGREGTKNPILENLEPWAGGTGTRPWAPPDNQQKVKTSKDPSVVKPPLYDTNPST